MIERLHRESSRANAGQYQREAGPVGLQRIEPDHWPAGAEAAQRRPGRTEELRRELIREERPPEAGIERRQALELPPVLDQQWKDCGGTTVNPVKGEQRRAPGRQRVMEDGAVPFAAAKKAIPSRLEQTGSIRREGIGRGKQGKARRFRPRPYTPAPIRQGNHPRSE